MQVDGVVVDEHRRCEEIHLADDDRPRMPGRVDDHDVFRGTDPERYLRRREVLARPIPAVVVGEPDMPFLGEEREQVVRGNATQRIARVEGYLERSGADVAK